VSTSGGSINPPRQQRSQETLARILDAADRILDGRSFDELSVEEVLIEADVSRSSFYARFSNKSALLPALFDRYRARVLGQLGAFATLDVESVAPDELVEAMVSEYVAFIRRFGSLVSAWDRDWAEPRNDHLHDEVSEAVVDLYLRCIGRDDDLARQRVRFASRSIAAVLLRAMNPPASFAARMGLSDAQLIAETTRLGRAYLHAALAED
jgi:AcrR family transcriptional regulator